MAQISSYPLLTPQLGDKVLGSNTTDAAGNSVAGNPTVQYNFKDVKALVDQQYVQQLQSSSTVITQLPTQNTTYNIRFGAPVLALADNVQLLQGTGTATQGDLIRFNIAGTYSILLNYSIGSNAANTEPYLVFRTLKNSATQIGPTVVYQEKFEQALKGVPFIIPLTVQVIAADTFNFQMACSGNSGYGLVRNAAAISGAITPTFTAPSIATITISKLV